jgi:hypothetical protein
MIVGTCKADRIDIQHSDDPRAMASSVDGFWNSTVALQLMDIVNY